MERVKPDRNAYVNLYLFGLFAGGLLLSHLVVNARSGIHLSGPIRLTGQGISVALPTGPGWQTLDNWKYERDNSYTLIGQYTLERYALAEVRWQYLLAAEPLEAEQILEQQLARLQMPYPSISRLSEPVDFVWTSLYPEEGEGEAAMGLTVLEPGKILLLQVRAQNQPLLAEELFLSLAKSVHYKASGASQAGREFVRAARETDFSSEQLPTEYAFLISDVSGTKIGYSITESTGGNGANTAWKVQMETTQHIRSGRSVEQQKEQLYVDPFLENLDWNCVIQSPRARQAVQYRLERLDSGALRQTDSGGSERILWPSAVTIPDALVPQAAALLLERPETEIMVDMVSCRGEVVPARFKKIPVEEAGAKADELHAVVRVEYLHRDDNSEEIYFDENGTIIGKLEILPGRRIRVWDRATEEEILFHFGNLFQKPDQSARNTQVPQRPWVSALAEKR